MSGFFDESDLPEELPRLVIIDLESMLDASRALRVRALATALAQLGRRKGLRLEGPSNTQLELLSADIEQNLDILGPNLSEENLDQLLELVQEAKLQEVRNGKVRLCPELPEALGELREYGYSLAIFSTDSRDCMLGIIDYFELDRYIDLSICSSDCGTSDPGIGLLEIVENQEVLRSETVFVSSRPAELEMARRAGILAVGCQWGGALDEELVSADRIVATPGELVDWLTPGD